MAGINALGRGQDREALVGFISTIAQTMGPEVIGKFLDPTEYLKRLAAAQGIEIMNLVKTPQQLEAEMQQAQQMQQQQTLMNQAGQLASTPVMDPSKNPNAEEVINNMTATVAEQQQPPE